MVLPKNLSQYAEQFWPVNTSNFAGGGGEREAAVEKDSISVVTAFFDIDRGGWNQNTSEVATKYNRSVDKYFEYFSHLAFLKNELIIFTSPNLAARVLQLRREAGLSDRTVIFTIDGLFERPEVRVVRDAISRQMTDQFRGFVWRPNAPEYNKADYVLLTVLKMTFACTAIDKKVIKSPQLAWIDFGYCRDSTTFDPEIEWKYFAGDKINIFNIFKLDERPVYDIIRGGEVYFQGGHIIGPLDAWPGFNRKISDALVSLLDCNLIDDEQTLMLMAWRRSPESFIVHRHSIDPELDWRFVFKRFRSGQTPNVGELPEIRKNTQPSWWRDLKNSIRRQIRRWRRDKVVEQSVGV